MCAIPAGPPLAPVWSSPTRVKVGFDQLKLWYKVWTICWRRRHASKRNLPGVAGSVRLQPDLAFYDITSTYFEGPVRKNWAASATAGMGKPATAGRHSAW